MLKTSTITYHEHDCREAIERNEAYDLFQRSASLESDHRSDALSFVHKIESLVDSLQRERVSDHGIDLDLAAQVSLDVTGQLRAAFDSAKGCSAPDPPGNQLERSSADFLSGCRDADDGRFTPPFVTTLQGGAHRLYVADAFKRVVDAAVGHIDDHFLNRPAVIARD